MDYQTVFDLSVSGFKSWQFSFNGILFIVAGFVLVLGRKRFPGKWRNNPKLSAFFAYFFLIFSLVWTTSAFLGTYSEYLYLSGLMKSGKYSTAEGVVEHFEPMPHSGHALEKFCVQNNCFEYSDYRITSGFNNTSSHGGPIKDGLYVRVAFVDNKIIKLEVKK